MGAGLVAAGVSAVAGVAGGMMQASAISGAADKSVAESRAAREQARADLEPWAKSGKNALAMTDDLSGANGPDAAMAAMANYRTSPGYQWQLDQGLRATDAGAAAKGMLRSGATLKAEQAYGAGLADQDFGQYYKRLYDLSNQGQNSAAGQASASQSAGHDIAQTDASAGTALANVYGNMASGVSNALTNYSNQSLYQNRTNALSGGGTIYGSGGDSLNMAANRAFFRG